MDSIICADLYRRKGNFVVDFWVKEEIKMYKIYTETGWRKVNMTYLKDFYAREIDKTEEECGWTTFEDWYADMLRCDLIRHIGR